MKRVAAKFVPKLLNFEQKHCGSSTAQEAKKETVIMPQPPYSPDFSPCYFSLFSKLQKPMKENRFDTIDKIKSESKKELMAKPKSAFQK